MKRKEGRTSNKRPAGKADTTSLEAKSRGGNEASKSAAALLFESRERMKTLRGSHWRDMRAELAEVYKVSAVLRANEDEWLYFCRVAEWEGFRGRPKLGDRPDALRYAIRVAVGLSGGLATRRASKYHIALEPFFKAGKPASQIPGLIKRGGGIEKLARANVKKPRTAPRPTKEYLTIKLPRDARGERIRALKIGEQRRLTFKVEGKAGGVIHARTLRLTKPKPRPSAL